VYRKSRAHAAISAKNIEAKKKAWDEKDLKLEAMVPVLIILRLFT